MNTTVDVRASETRYCIGIDFGTTHSGYAFAHRVDKIVKTNFNWNKQPQPYCKDRTSILYVRDAEDDYKPLAFGYHALAIYLQRRPLEHDDFYVEKFKLLLDPSCRESILLPPKTTVQVVIADYLKYMKDLAIEALRAKFSGSFSEDYVLWCLTVPAIWTDKAKSIMRQACLSVGMIQSLESDRLLICLEPEAASVYLRHTPGAKPLIVGDTLSVCDCGGGTIDMSTYNIQDRGKMSELIASSGVLAGSTFIDSYFFAYVKNMVGVEAYDVALTQSPSIEISLLREWENIKRSFDGSKLDEQDFGVISLPNILQKRMKQEEKSALAENQEFFDDVIWLSGKTIQGFFDKVIEKLVKALSEHLDQAEITTSNLLVVGGFAESRYLLHCLRREFERDHLQILSISEPGSAIIQGAVLSGLDPTIVTARKSKLTYAIGSSEKFNSIHHDKSKRFWCDEQHCYMTKVLSVFVRSGQLVERDESITHSFVPLIPSQSQIKFKLYATAEKHPCYPDDEGCHELASLKITYPSDCIVDQNYKECQKNGNNA
ncbi:hypothetical protein K7432_005075 [Basidiobolus ranarum]|uniref:Uncharacterized protein n=1 Tax=Basidiobolus ranarum TaxID=34480 RepID=A0ABR2WXB4_9FUNG